MLEELDFSQYRHILVVVAHPDDPEYGISAVVHDAVAQGVSVSYLLLTHGEAGIAGKDPVEVAALRAEEQRAACHAVGVDDLILLDFPDGHLEYSLPLRKAIARVIRTLTPDAVVTSNFEVFAPWGPNQADHRVAGLAALDACRDADNEWVHRDLAEAEGLARHHVDAFLVANPNAPTHFARVSKAGLDAGVASLEQHREYLAALGPDYPAPRVMLGGALATAGKQAGCEQAVLFTAHAL